MRIDCNNCPLCKNAISINIPSRGSTNPKILFIGEAPGKTEDQENTTFCGKAGRELDRLMALSEIDPSVCRWANIVRCIPWDSNKSSSREPTELEIYSCLPWLEDEILTTDPKIIVTLGNTALHAVVNTKLLISEARRKKYIAFIPSYKSICKRIAIWGYKEGIPIKELQDFTPNSIKKYIKFAESVGFPKIEQKQYTVYPTFHPSASLRGNEYITESIVEDLSFVKRFISGNSLKFDRYLYCDSIDKIKLAYDVVKYLYDSSYIKCISIDLESNGLDPFTLENPRVLLWSIAFCVKCSNEAERIFCKELLSKLWKECLGKNWDSLPLAFSVLYEHSSSPFLNDIVAKEAILNLTQDFINHVPIVNQNIKFDLRWLSKIGIDISSANIAGDTMLASWTLWNDTIYSHSLEYLSTKYVDMPHHKEEMHEALSKLNGRVYDKNGLIRQPTMDDVDIDLVHRYCCLDADSTIRLHHKFDELLIENDLYEPHYDICVPAILPTTLMEINGAKLDLNSISSASREFEHMLDDSYSKITNYGYDKKLLNILNKERSDNEKYSSFKRNKEKSSLQLTNSAEKTICYDILGLSPIKEGKTGPSVDKESINKMIENCQSLLDVDKSDSYAKHCMEVLKLLKDFNKLQKIHNSYIKTLPEFVDKEDKIHTNYGVRTTRTGRYNSRGPSFHIIPKKQSVIKKAFVPSNQFGLILNADFSQMELRILASLSNDAAMIKAFEDNTDFHRKTAASINKKDFKDVSDDERSMAKSAVFGIVYGSDKSSIAEKESITVAEAGELIDGLFKTYPGVKTWIDHQHNLCKKSNSVFTPTGFRRIMDRGLDKGEKCRRFVNTPIQGSASDVGCVSLQNLVKLIKNRKLKSKLFGFVHDALVTDVYPGELYDICCLTYKAMSIMPRAKFDWIKVPLRVDIEAGPNWGDLCSISILEGRKLRFNESSVDFYNKITNIFDKWVPKVNLFSSVVEEDKSTKKIVKKVTSEWVF